MYNKAQHKTCNFF